MKQTALRLLAMLLAVTALLAGCGEAAPEQTQAPETVQSLAAGEPLELTGWELSTTTWSSPNGATVNLTATPNGYTQGQGAAFIVRLEGEEVDNVPCQWDGTHYTASVDLNAADGYCYYVLLTAADGSQKEVSVNTPNAITDEALINMASALQSYCAVTVVASQQEGDKLTISEGTVSIQLPLITNEGEQILCSKAQLVLTYDGEAVDTVDLETEDTPDAGAYNLSIAGTTLNLPQLEDDQAVELRLDVELSNGQFLSALGGSWFSQDGQLMLIVG